MMSKTCENCGKTFYKQYTRSRADFLKRAKFCSNSCKVYKQKGFYKHWQGKKRPDLLQSGAAKTMFKLGIGGYCPPEKKYKKHGLSKTKLYDRYRSIKYRCKTNLLYLKRKTKCEWKSFEEFYADMHESYYDHAKIHGKENTTIDRINNEGNYSKENCRWATRDIQQRNRSNNHMITFNGKTQCMVDWAKEIGISYTSLWKRLKKMPLDKALTINYFSGKFSHGTKNN